LYLTFAGLLRLVSNSSNKVAKRFGEWMCDIVFAAWFGTAEQRMRVSAKILDIGIEQLAAIMGKCANNIACIYLIDIKRENDGRRVYKYGRTNSIRRRFREHTKTYGDDIELVKFGFIPASDCVKAESDLRNFVKDFAYSGDEDLADRVELIQLNKEELNQTINQMLEISDAASGNMHDQLAIYEVKMKDKDHELTEARHQLALKDKDLELKDKDIEHLKAEHQAELKDKDIALLRAEHRAAQAESELKILRLQLELAQLKGH
jgi:hypothetical protein